MASRTATPTGKESSGRGLKPRSMPFLGLLLMPFGAYALGLAVHISVRDTPVAVSLVALLLGVVTTGLAVLAYLLGRKRDPVVCWHVVVTVVLAGLGEATTVVVGVQRWWTTTFLILGLIVSLSWGLHRIDALRRDPNKTDEVKEDPLAKKLGLEHTKFGRAQHHYDKEGDLIRVEVPVQHGPGETAEVIQAAVPGLESVADQVLPVDVPRGRSRAVPTAGAGASTLVIITKDVLKDLVEYAGPSSPGGCITEPLVTAMAEDQQLGQVFIAGGHPAAANPSSSGWMGMTRTGKTMNAQVRALEIMSRRNAVMMWFDTIKGAQTVRPMRHGLDIIVASDDPKSFRAGMKALEKLIMWRATRLGECGYRAWTPECATDPRLMMPFLIPHFEEADALCDLAPDEMVFLASKGLSTGVSLGISLQRADATSMPTGLRFNIGNWSCFGTGDSYSAGFALSDHTINAGAHPENWKQSKVGYHYTEGIGIPDERWPIPHKSMFATDQAMEAHTAVWAPRMMPLDQGSIAALGGWYADAKTATRQLVAHWDRGPAAEPVVHDGVSTGPNTPTAAVAEADDDLSGERERVIEEMEEMLRDGDTAPQVDDEANRVDTSKPIPPPAADDLSWADKDAAPTREAALDAFRRALEEIADDGSLVDDDGEGVVFQVATLVDRYKFRSRPWFSDNLTAAAEGRLNLPGLRLSRVVDDGARPGTYRVERVSEPVGANNGT